MPNWCSTKIVITCKDSDEAKHLKDLIKEWTSKDYAENGFGDNWLGNVVIGSGVGTVDNKRIIDVKCRGTVEYVDQFLNEIVIETETAWEPMLRIWFKVINRYAPGAVLKYMATEDGCGIYCTNYDEMVGNYNVDSCEIPYVDNIIRNMDSSSMSEEDVINILCELLDTNENKIDKLLEMLQNSEYYDQLFIHKWEYAPAEGWE